MNSLRKSRNIERIITGYYLSQKDLLLQSAFSSMNWRKLDLEIKSKEVCLTSQPEVTKNSEHIFRYYINAGFQFEFSSNVLGDVRKLYDVIPENAILVTLTYSRLWSPIIRFAEIMKVKKRKPHCNINQDRKSTRLNSSHSSVSRMPSSA